MIKPHKAFTYNVIKYDSFKKEYTLENPYTKQLLVKTKEEVEKLYAEQYGRKKNYENFLRDLNLFRKNPTCIPKFCEKCVFLSSRIILTSLRISYCNFWKKDLYDISDEDFLKQCYSGDYLEDYNKYIQPDNYLFDDDELEGCDNW